MVTTSILHHQGWRSLVSCYRAAVIGQLYTNKNLCWCSVHICPLKWFKILNPPVNSMFSVL